jgi:hypothetical protein
LLGLSLQGCSQQLLYALRRLKGRVALRRALGSCGRHGLAVLPFLDSGRSFDKRHLEFC